VLILADTDPALMTGAGVALGMVVGFAAAKLLPYAAAWLRGHNHPMLADVAGAVAIAAQEHENGKDVLQSFSTALRSPELKDLFDRALSKQA